MSEEIKCPYCAGKTAAEDAAGCGEVEITAEGSCCRIKHRSEKEYRDLIHRLNRIEGQVRGIRAMLESDRYCVDILTQVSAVKSALDAFDRVLLNQHIHTCVVERIREGDEEVVDELCSVIQKLMK